MKCLDCGNEVAFVHEVEGTETRLYNKAGEFVEAEYQQFETRRVSCANTECESDNVEIE